MNKVERLLVNTRQTLREACDEANTDFSDLFVVGIDTCSSCGLWQKNSLFKLDLDGNPICSYCLASYGL